LPVKKKRRSKEKNWKRRKGHSNAKKTKTDI
jgi:hypothetical protein